jgi:hypothetical protein
MGIAFVLCQLEGFRALKFISSIRLFWTNLDWFCIASEKIAKSFFYFFFQPTSWKIFVVVGQVKSSHRGLLQGSRVMRFG